MKSIRRAIGIAQALYGVERPLVTMRFMHDGKDIFIGELEKTAGSRYVNLSRHGQIAWEHIRDVLRDLDYDDDVAARWWPAGHETPIVIDPRVSFGRPYVASKGISTDAIRSRFLARESIDDIVDDFDLTAQEVEAALRFELHGHPWGSRPGSITRPDQRLAQVLREPPAGPHPARRAAL